MHKSDRTLEPMKKLHKRLDVLCAHFFRRRGTRWSSPKIANITIRPLKVCHTELIAFDRWRLTGTALSWPSATVEEKYGLALCKNVCRFQRTTHHEAYSLASPRAANRHESDQRLVNYMRERAWCKVWCRPFFPSKCWIYGINTYRRARAKNCAEVNADSIHCAKLCLG